MYHVKAWASWADVGNDTPLLDQEFATELAALRAAEGCPPDAAPLVDIYANGRYIADRHLIAHPLLPKEYGFIPRDTIPGALARLVGAS